VRICVLRQRIYESVPFIDILTLHFYRFSSANNVQTKTAARINFVQKAARKMVVKLTLGKTKTSTRS
jgi:hypothetical protein